MIKKSAYLQILNNTVLRHILFWGLAFIYYLSVSWPYKTNKILLIEVTLFELILQMLIAYSVIYFFIPKLLNRNKKLVFFMCMLVISYLAHLSFSTFISFRWIKETEVLSKSDFFFERITSLSQYLRSIPSYALPMIILVIFGYYKKQKEIANLLEQKRTSELNLLKQQLNPHFLFNTLNNLYILVLEKSDKAAQIVGKLSEILDYILYQCKDKYVPLYKEVKLLENYIVLEKVRYGSRVEVSFEKQIYNDVKIAPLILLNFVENAFKHGVSQEVDKAFISLFISSSEKEIVFKLKNTKPKFYVESLKKDKGNIGMNNTEKQLELLYPNTYNLDIINTEFEYDLELKIQHNGKI
ncbi:sensor histidine kinase [Psychroserpens ponticola]|uniref:Histidine kinase n=1 Tax=Psychroserpens ponticola TaxID=2932268 RepID=A0ABY7RT75_9FLAO|nr:histidine kinase [Psychroserpens ponticola]WCO00307.1 histidine kinase [Psychroserpens ponticola]